MARAKKGDLLRFVHDVIENSYGPGPCIIWPYGVTSMGYPHLHVNGKDWLATRYVMLAIDGGPDKADLQVAHQPLICHSRLCIRPGHLRWATRSENALDKNIDGTTGRRLTLDVAQEMRSRYAAGGTTYRQLAIEYGITAASVCHVIRGRTWAERKAAS